MKKIITKWQPWQDEPKPLQKRIPVAPPPLHPRQEMVNLALHSLARHRLIYSEKSERLAALIKEFNRRLRTKPVSSMKKVIHLWLNQ